MPKFTELLKTEEAKEKLEKLAQKLKRAEDRKNHDGKKGSKRGKK